MKNIVLHIVPEDVNTGPVNVARDIVSGLKESGVHAELTTLKNAEGYVFFGVIKKLFLVLRNDDVKILHSHGIVPDVFCFFIALVSNKSWVTTVHNDPREDLKFLYPKTFKVICLLWLSVLRKANRVVVLTNHIRQEIKLNNVTTVVNSRRLNLEGFEFNNSLAERNNCTTLGFCGALIERKNVLKLVKEFTLIDDSKLLVAGDGPLKSELEELLTKSANSNITLLGFKGDLEAFWKEIDILILPSFAEGVPLVAIEALAHGKPIILLDLVNYSGIFTSKECLFLQELSESTIRKSIAEIVKRYPEYSSAAVSAYKTKFSYSNWILEYKNVYDLNVVFER